MNEILHGTEPFRKDRLLALDVLRGITIALMIIVNEPGISTDVYAPLRHTVWNGLTPTDLVAPSFLFIVGVSVVLAYSKQLLKGTPRKKMVRKMAGRAVIMFVLGVLLSIAPLFDFSDIRIPGVLQRISIVFFCCGLLFLYTSWKFQAWLSAIILVGYWMALTLIPVPGFGYPILEPGKNLAAWLDQMVIPGRMWQGTWDPEGILSTFPAIISGVTGMLAGHLIISKKSTEHKIIWLFIGGFLAFVTGNIWDLTFETNENLWTSSFVMYTSGVTSMALGTLYFIVDVLGYKRWAKLPIIYGSNAITAYLVAELFSDLLFLKWGGTPETSANHIIMQAVLKTGIRPEIASVLWALSFCALCFIPIYILYKKKIFLKI